MKVFWRVEIDDQGGIGSVERCESKGTNGRKVIYVEALSKEVACSAAKAWHANYLVRSRRKLEVRHALLAKGLCQDCRRRPLASATYCEECRQAHNARSVNLRNGAPRKYRGKATSIIELHERELEAKRRYVARRGSGELIRLECLVKQLDAMGPEKFRAHLVERITALRAKHGLSAEPDQQAQAAE